MLVLAIVTEATHTAAGADRAAPSVVIAEWAVAATCSDAPAPEAIVAEVPIVLASGMDALA